MIKSMKMLKYIYIYNKKFSRQTEFCRDKISYVVTLFEIRSNNGYCRDMLSFVVIR